MSSRGPVKIRRPLATPCSASWMSQFLEEWVPYLADPDEPGVGGGLSVTGLLQHAPAELGEQIGALPEIDGATAQHDQGVFWNAQLRAHLVPEGFSLTLEIAGSGLQSVVHRGDLIRVDRVSIDHRPAYRVGRDDHAARRSRDPVNGELSAEVIDRDRQLMDPGENGDLLLREGRVKIAEAHGVADRDAAAGILPESSRKFCGDVGKADPVGGEGVDIQRGSDPGKGVGQLTAVQQEDPAFNAGELGQLLGKSQEAERGPGPGGRMRDQQHLVVAVLAGGLPRGLSQVSPGKSLEVGSLLGKQAVRKCLHECWSAEDCPGASQLRAIFLTAFFVASPGPAVTVTCTNRERTLQHRPESRPSRKSRRRALQAFWISIQPRLR